MWGCYRDGGRQIKYVWWGQRRRRAARIDWINDLSWDENTLVNDTVKSTQLL